MYTTIIHPIRKALCLSIEEYVVLDTIYHLCNNEKYGHWCIMTKEKLAECLDLSRATIFRVINTLESKNLIIRDEATSYLKTKDNFNEMIANKHDWIIGFKGKETALISGKTDLPYQNDTNSLNLTPLPSQNDTVDSIKLIRNNNKDNNNNSKYTRARKRKGTISFGEEGTIRLSSEEYVKLRRLIGIKADFYIQKVENWKLSKGKNYKNDYRGILNWIQSDKEKGILRTSHEDLRPDDFDKKEDYENTCLKLINQNQ